MVDACRRASARQITAVHPLLRLCRADRKKPLAANPSPPKWWPICLGDLGGGPVLGHGLHFLPGSRAISIFPVITSTDHRCWLDYLSAVISVRWWCLPWMSVASARARALPSACTMRTGDHRQNDRSGSQRGESLTRDRLMWWQNRNS